MDVEIEVDGRTVPCRLDEKQGRWHCPQEPQEADFPLVAVAAGKRYELYSDGTFAEVEV